MCERNYILGGMNEQHRDSAGIMKQWKEGKGRPYSYMNLWREFC